MEEKIRHGTKLCCRWTFWSDDYIVFILSLVYVLLYWHQTVYTTQQELLIFIFTDHVKTKGDQGDLQIFSKKQDTSCTQSCQEMNHHHQVSNKKIVWIMVPNLKKFIAPHDSCRTGKLRLVSSFFFLPKNFIRRKMYLN